MADLEVVDPATLKYDLGRCIIYRAPQWDGSGNLAAALTYLCNTEGDLKITKNPEYSDLVVKESFGPGILKRYVTGFKPSFEVGIYPNETLKALLSPTGTGSIGHARQRRVTTHTLWIAPEQLFLKEQNDGSFITVEVSLNGGVWTKDGQAFTEEDQENFDSSRFLWKVSFTPVDDLFKHAEGGNALVPITGECMIDLNKPEGHYQITTGKELEASGIDLEGESSS